MGYRRVDGRWTRRVSGQGGDPDSEDELRQAEAGPSGTTAEAGPSQAGPSEAGPSGTAAGDEEPVTPPAGQSDAPSMRRSDDTDRSLIHQLSLRMEDLQSELRAHVTQTECHLTQLRTQMESGFKHILQAIQRMTSIPAPTGPPAPPDSPPSSPQQDDSHHTTDQADPADQATHEGSQTTTDQIDATGTIAAPDEIGRAHV